jgi:hypothetical protein
MVSDLRVKAVGNRSDYSIRENLDRLYFRHKSGSWQKFAMTSLETLYTKNAVNELSFLLITHTDYFDTRFGCYGFLKLGYGAELF